MKHANIILGLVLCLSLSAAFAYQNFHGCTLASDNVTGWVVTLDSTIILKTTDGGVNWTEQPNPADRRFFDVTCFGNQNAWTCGILGQICYTSNSGQSWAIQLPGGSAKYSTRLEFIDASHGWVVCGDGVVMRTVNGGTNWEANFTPFIFLPELYGVSFIDTMRGWIVSGWPDSADVGQAVIARSTDGGIIWDSLFTCTNYDDYFDVHFFDSSNGIIAGGNEQNYAALILRSTDGGVSWSQVSVPGTAFYLRALDFVGGQGWAVGRFGTIIHTHDYGQTWVFQTNPATSTLFDVDFSDAQNGIACGTGIILYTHDGGDTWHDGTGIYEDNKERKGNSSLCAYPNPFSDKTTIRYTIQDARYRIKDMKIFDASGRLVKVFEHESCIMDHASGLTWDGVDETGKRVPPGVYMVQLRDGDGTVTAKIVRE